MSPEEKAASLEGADEQDEGPGAGCRDGFAAARELTRADQSPESEADGTEGNAGGAAHLLFSGVEVLSPLEELRRVFLKRSKRLRGVESLQSEDQLSCAYAIAKEQLAKALRGDQAEPRPGHEEASRVGED